MMGVESYSVVLWYMDHIQRWARWSDLAIRWKDGVRPVSAKMEKHPLLDPYMKVRWLIFFPIFANCMSILFYNKITIFMLNTKNE